MLVRLTWMPPLTNKVYAELGRAVLRLSWMCTEMKKVISDAEGIVFEVSDCFKDPKELQKELQLIEVDVE